MKLISRWFIDKANRIRKKVINGVSVSVTAGDKDPYSMLAYYGYHSFPFPLVVLFEDEGRYTVAIKDKEARIEKVE